MFNVFINDINKAIDYNTLKLYAEDSLLYKPIVNLSDPSDFQSNLDNLVDWAGNSQMHVYIKKCEHMSIKCAACNTPNTRYTMNSGEPLSKTDKVEYLGVSIDDKLSFNPHIIKVCSKANRSLHMFDKISKESQA